MFFWLNTLEALKQMHKLLQFGNFLLLLKASLA